ncbi:MAG: bifunctional hydroxymethylpyrimidine kinase/phosphomethylpyrimidine kinase [Haloarculaceae archaeon]
MTRNAAPVSPPVVLSIAGSDSGGGAGIQADTKTIEAGGAFATTAITSVTAQHTRGVTSTHVLPVDEIRAQIDAVREDFDVAAIKTGMLATTAVVDLVTDVVADASAPTVVDPVMVAASGDRLLDPKAEAAYEDLIVAADLVTPNAQEAAVLAGHDVEDEEDARMAAEALVEMGAGAALVTGGHLEGDAAAEEDPEDDHGGDIHDVLVTPDVVETIHHERIDTDATHGSGCTISSAIATRLAHGDELPAAVESSVDLLGRAVRYHLDVGEGPGAVHHTVALRERAERQPTEERVAEIVRRFIEVDVSRLVPEVGMNVVGATPYAEDPAECAAVDGRITRTLDGVEPNRGIRVGASSHVARFLLATREFDGDLRFAVNCRFDDEIDAALEGLDWPVAEFDRDAEPADLKASEGSTMAWGARAAFAEAGETPVAVVDRGEVGKEAIVKLLAADSATLAERVLTLLDAVE